MTDITKQKLVVLGGGAGSLSTVYALTNEPDWKDRYESITVYQMGWRLGGKGASGRGRDGRIEEHGLHIWMGWYQNAFQMMRAVYKELGRNPNVPLAHWDDAFKRHSYICFGEEVNGTWTAWPFNFSADKDTPGTGREYPTLWDYIHLVLDGLVKLLDGSFMTTPPPDDSHGLARLAHEFLHIINRIVTLGRELGEILQLEEILRRTRKVAAGLRDDPSSHEQSHSDDLARAMHDVREMFRKHLERDIEHKDEARRLFYVIDTAVTCVAGVLSEVPHFTAHALDALDKYDFREFLLKYGADPATVQSSLIRAFYDLLFAYRNGDPNDQSAATGVSIRFIFRMALTYDGAIFWKMQAGMGDTIFTPIYEVLKRRGVQFKFFHRVQNLELTEDGRSVARIHVGRQAALTGGEYQPFVTVNELPCWPSDPLYDQLVEGAELQKAEIDLESLWTPWKAREVPVVLEKGTHFDVIVFGISLASIPYVAPELVKASPKWQAMLQYVETVRTQALQLWIKRDLAGLGWSAPSAVADAYPEPLDTWADMSHLIPRESWRSAAPPGNITYFCAPMIGGIPPESNENAPAEEAAKVKQASLEWLNKFAGTMWPAAMTGGSTPGFDWSVLVDPDEATGAKRLDAQFWKANIDPSERYVLSVPGSTAYRLHADQPDFDNLYVTGDWTYTAVNAGCVEGTVMSGLLTASAMTGRPGKDAIIGYNNP
jgi:uncharacterized protein with NAD-binding domain and iron-sulfur cluster